MEVYKEEDYKTHYVGHLGLVASKIHELDLINFIDTRLPISKETLPAAANRIHALCQGLREARDFIHVGDSAMYSNILQYSETMHWISRVPENIKEEDLLSSMPEDGLAWVKLDEGYSYYSSPSSYKNVAQRWVMYFSKASATREIATLNKPQFRSVPIGLKEQPRPFTIRASLKLQLDVKTIDLHKLLLRRIAHKMN